MNLPGHHEPITTVVSRSAKYHKALSTNTDSLPNDFEHCQPGIFHQQFVNNAVGFNCGLIQSSHMGYVTDFHRAPFLFLNFHIRLNIQYRRTIDHVQPLDSKLVTIDLDDFQYRHPDGIWASGRAGTEYSHGPVTVRRGLL